VGSGPKVLTSVDLFDKQGERLMKSAILVLLLAVIGSLTFAQTQTTKATKEEKTRQELTQIERDIGRANIDRDYNYFVTKQTRFTDVFVWRDGRWQIVAGHSSRIRK
jgi:preprotein translocase subunit Sec63